MELRERISSFPLLNSDIILFRGQSCASWNLESGLFRFLRDNNLIDEFYNQEENEFDLFFKDQRFSNWANHTYTQKLAIAQHYHAKTSLLDWTESWEIALWFAFNDDEIRIERALYFIIIDQIDILTDYTEDIRDDRFIRFVNPQKFLFNPRIQNQRGWFSTQPADIMPKNIPRNSFSFPQFDNLRLIEEDSHFDFKITKFILPEFMKNEVLNYLDRKGINENFIYPDK